MKRLFICAQILALFVASAAAQDSKPSVQIPFFGNAKCPVSGEPVKQRLFVEHEGQRIYVCCKNCIKKVSADPETYLAKAYPANAVVDLKNASCPIMKRPAKAEVSTVFQGHRVHFCCKGCDKKFRKAPIKHLALLTHEGLKDAGNAKCPVETDDEVDGETYVIYAGKLIGLCCKKCVRKFRAHPEVYAARLANDEHGKEAGEDRGHDHDHDGGH